MSFVKFEPSKGRPVLGISVSESAVYLNKAIYEGMGSPKRVNLYYDLDNKSIKIEASTDGRRVLCPIYGSPTLTIRLSKIMPIGRYSHQGDGIFLLD